MLGKRVAVAKEIVAERRGGGAEMSVAVSGDALEVRVVERGPVEIVEGERTHEQWAEGNYLDQVFGVGLVTSEPFSIKPFFLYAFFVDGLAFPIDALVSGVTGIVAAASDDYEVAHGALGVLASFAPAVTCLAPGYEGGTDRVVGERIQRRTEPGPLALGGVDVSTGEIGGWPPACRLRGTTDAVGRVRFPLDRAAKAWLTRIDAGARVELAAGERRQKYAGVPGEVVEIARQDITDTLRSHAVRIAEAKPDEVPDPPSAYPRGVDPRAVYWSAVALRNAGRDPGAEAAGLRQLRRLGIGAPILEAEALALLEGRGARIDGRQVDSWHEGRTAGSSRWMRGEVRLRRRAPSSGAAAGEDLELELSVTHAGEGDFDSFWAHTRSAVPEANGRVILMGRIAPGETAQRRVRLPVPAAVGRQQRVEVAFDSGPDAAWMPLVSLALTADGAPAGGAPPAVRVDSRYSAFGARGGAEIVLASVSVAIVDDGGIASCRVLVDGKPLEATATLPDDASPAPRAIAIRETLTVARGKHPIVVEAIAVDGRRAVHEAQVEVP
jgi:hypothetical protein